MSSQIQSLSRPSWTSHLRALWMIAVNDWVHYWRYPLNVIGSILQPLIWLAPVYYMGQAFSVDGEARGFAAFAGTTDYISFVLLGTVINNYIMTVFWGMGYALKRDMDSGVLESNWLMPIPRPMLLIGRTFSSLLTTTLVSAVMLVFGTLLFGFHPTGNALLGLLPVLPMLIGLYGFGLAFAAIVLLMRDANTLVDISSFVVGQLSGSSFPIQALPRFLIPVSLAIPITFGLDAMRGYMLETTTVIPIQYEIVILVVFMFALVWLGLLVFNRMERKVRTLGTLGQH